MQNDTYFMRIRKHRLTKPLFFISLILLLYGVLRSTPPQQYFEHSDKVLHVIAFFSVTFLGRLGLITIPGRVYWPIAIISSAGLELLQGVLWTTRIFSIGDGVANIAGVFLAMFVYSTLRYFHRRLSSASYSD